MDDEMHDPPQELLASRPQQPPMISPERAQGIRTLRRFMASHGGSSSVHEQPEDVMDGVQVRVDWGVVRIILKRMRLPKKTANNPQQNLRRSTCSKMA